MNNQSLNLLDLVVPSTTADTNIHTFMEFKDWINSSFTLQTQLNPPSYITKNTEVRSLRVRKGKSLAYENAERPFNKITTSLTKKLSIAYNDQLNQIEERGENLEHSAMDESKNNGILRKQSFGGELGFDLLRQTSLRRSHSAQSSISVNGFEQINQYQLVKLLGRGAFADVYLAIDVESPTKKEYAVKILCSKKIKKRLHLRKSSMMLQGPPSPPPDLQEQSPIPIEKKSDSKSKKSKHTLADLFVRNQVAILKKMNHRYITKLYDVIIDNVKQKVYLVLQYCSGGFIGYHRDKDNEIEWKTPYRKLLESECKRYTKQMALALDYIHNVAKIAHRDIKPENILLSELDEIKISDFGLGTHKLKGQKYAGTPLFMPPEAQLNPDQKTNEDVKEQGDAKAGDIWALGVTLLVLLSGRHPEFTSNKIDVEYEISKIKKDISEPCKNFIQKCLQRDASKRIKAEQLMGHKWLGGQVIKHVKESEAIVVTLSEQENVISLRKGPEELREKGEKIEFKENESEKLFNQFGEEVGQSYTTSFPPTSFKIMIDQ